MTGLLVLLLAVAIPVVLILLILWLLTRADERTVEERRRAPYPICEECGMPWYDHAPDCPLGGEDAFRL